MPLTLTLTTTSCDDNKDDNSGFSGKMTINGQTETINSAFYTEAAANNRNEAYFRIVLLKDAYSDVPEPAPECYITLLLSESLYGKTLDLTQPIRKSGPLDNGLNIVARSNTNHSLVIAYTSDGVIKVISGEVDATVTSGVLTVTRSGDNFAIKFSMTLSDGNSIAADWKGTATKFEKNDKQSVSRRN